MNDEDYVGFLLNVAQDLRQHHKLTVDEETEVQRTPTPNQPASNENEPLRGFIGSSGNGKPIAWALQHALADDFDISVWDQMIFSASTVPMETIENVGKNIDFAILIVTPDDIRTKHGETTVTARDNVVFEIGYFFGKLGRNRVFLVAESNNVPTLPTDLAGITDIRFRLHKSGQLGPSVGPAATQIRQVLGKLNYVGPASKN